MHLSPVFYQFLVFRSNCLRQSPQPMRILRFSQCHVAEQNMTPRHIPERNVTLYHIPEEKLVTLRHIPEQNMTPWHIPERNVTLRHIPEQNMMLHHIPEEGSVPVCHPRRTDCDAPSHSVITECDLPSLPRIMQCSYQRYVLPSVDIPSFPLVQNNRQNYSSVCFNLYIFRYGTARQIAGARTAVGTNILHLLLFSCSYISQTATLRINVQTILNVSSTPFCFLQRVTYIAARADAINHRFSSGIRLLALPPALTVKWL